MKKCICPKCGKLDKPVHGKRCGKCVSEAAHKRYLKNKTRVIAKAKQYYKDNRSKVVKYKQEYHQKNKEKIVQKVKDWAIKNNQKRKQYQKEYRVKNKIVLAKNAKEYYQKNKKQINEYHRKYKLNKRRTDPIFKLKANMRTRLRTILMNKNIVKEKSTMKLVGCSIDTLINHLESKFQPLMTWKNYGKWHVDHKKPLNRAKTQKDIRKLFHYTNLQPLWAVDNLKKGSQF